VLLLPGAERERRALLLGAALILGGACAWWPVAPLVRFCDRALAPAAEPIATAADWVARRVAPAPTTAAPTPTPPSGWLDAVERAAAQPAPIAGLVWVEVPVIGIERHGSALRLGAGRAIGLAEGMVAACGDRFLGRIAEVEDERALLLHFRAADERTGVRLTDLDGAERDAILIGRSRRPALLAPIADGAIPAAAAVVRFRGRRSDPPALAAAGLVLGACAPHGDAQRGERAWVVDAALPTLAEGRVFVAAGALPAHPILPPAPAAAAARELLRGDAVLGARFGACVQDGALPAPPAVAQRAGRVLGPVLRRRGRMCWIRLDDAEHWIRREAALAAPAGAPAPGWFTRGDDVVPRGLWLGAPGDPAPHAGAVQLLVAPFPRDP
jgi:hypothetical protein